MFSAIAGLASRHRKLIVVVAGMLVALAGAASLGLHSQLASGWSDWDDPGAVNVQARQVIENSTGIDPQQGYVLLVNTDQHLKPGAPMPAAVRAAAQLLRQRPEVRQVLDYQSTHNPALISKNGRQTIVIGQVGHIAENQVIPELKAQIQRDPLLAEHVMLGGSSAGSVQVMSVVLHDLTFAELVVFPLLFVLLVLVFRGVVAALLPLIGGAVAVLITMLAMRVIVEFTALSVFGLNLVFALGLGLSIDFSLLIVSRYRTELRAAGGGLTTLQSTMNTAGRTVLFSGLTIGSALVALLVFPQRFLYSMGICGIVVVATALLYALVILPAILALLGGRVEALAPRRWQRRGERAGTTDPSAVRWRRIAHAVMRRPALSAGGAVVVLLALASPLLGVRFTAVQSANTLPGNVSAGHVAQVMARDFATPITDQEYAVVAAPAGAEASVGHYAHQVASTHGVAAVEAPRPLGDTHWLVPIILAGQPNSASAQAAVHRIGDLPAPFAVHVSGPTADGVTLDEDLGRHLPLAASILIAATLVVLFAMTGSVILPVKAVIMNALSLGAALGIVVFVFQHGHGAGLLGTTGQGALESTSPIILAAVAFGLSTDYGVFLLGRIKESHDLGLPNRDAVASGIENTGRIVTSAAALFCIAMLAMVLARLPFTKELGFGTALAVILDATVVRAILVPALMTMLGQLNWWAPKPLRALHTRVGLADLDAATPSNREPTPKPELIATNTNWSRMHTLDNPSVVGTADFPCSDQPQPVFLPTTYRKSRSARWTP
jgi:RND superfamily putative drug exporter